MLKNTVTAIIFAALSICLSKGFVGAETLTVVATDAVYHQAKEWTDFLEEKEITFRHVTPTEFAKGVKAKHIVLMGGLDEPRGIKDIVKNLLSEETLEQVGQKGAFKTIKKTVNDDTKFVSWDDYSLNYI